MEKRIEKFEDLQIWQEGVELAILIYASLQNCKDFGFRDQVQRASVSIPSNIAEGFDRLSNNEFIRFLKIAKGSCAELSTQLIIAHKVGLLADSTELNIQRNYRL
ncbi:MAG: four helix bundle protein [Salinivirgaceae bacterium]|nr:four helix bundle protein [Salinivirgaceae bacterium]